MEIVSKQDYSERKLVDDWNMRPTMFAEYHFIDGLYISRRGRGNETRLERSWLIAECSAGRPTNQVGDTYSLAAFCFTAWLRQQSP
jgi:hypothetical protein